MAETFRAAIQAGVSPIEFWSLTPYLTRLAIGAISDGRNTQSWILANLTRARKLPKLDDLLNRKREAVKTADVGLRLKAALMQTKVSVE